MSFSFDLNDSFASFAPATPPDGCTQCGICLPACPTYQKSQDVDQSPMGRIRLIRTLQNESNEGISPEKFQKLESCLGCYSCESVCPSKVNFGKLLDESLAQLRATNPLPRFTRIILWSACRVRFIRAFAQVSYVTQFLGIRALFSKLGLIKLFGLSRANDLLGKIIYPTQLKNHIQTTTNDQRVALFAGCFSSVMEQDIQQATIDVLNTLGLEVVLPIDQGCCGALHRHNGELQTAERLARKNIKAFTANKVDAIISTSSGCGASLKDYGEWLDDEEFSLPVMDVSHYLVNLLNQHEIKFKHLPLKIALHTPCTLRQNEGREEALIELLQKIPGLEIIPLSGEPRCCGAGGSQVLGQSEMADALRDDIVNEIKATKADLLVSSNLGCAMHLRNGLAQSGFDIPLQHPVQLILQSIIANNQSV